MDETNLAADEKTSGHNQTYYELLERFQQMPDKPERAACPVCQLTAQGVVRYMGSLAYESVTDYQAREGLRQAVGFCNRHAWQWHNQKDALATALIYGELSGIVLNWLQEQKPDAAKTGKSSAGLLGSLVKAFNPANKPTHNGFTAPGMSAREDLGFETCPACQVQRETETRVIEEFVGGLNFAAFRKAYMASFGICMPHLNWALKYLDAGKQRWLLDSEAQIWTKIRQELGTVADKYNFDHNRGRQEIGAEINAVQRAIWKAGGQEGLG